MIQCGVSVTNMKTTAAGGAATKKYRAIMDE
jgi:hypothetical protein